MQTFVANRRDGVVAADALAAFERDGFAVLTGMLRSDEIDEIKKVVMRLARHETAQGTAHHYGPSMQRVWNLLEKGAIFHDLITSPQVLAWMERLFDRPTTHQKYFLSSFQANIISPGAPVLKIHIDTPVPEPLPPWIIKGNTIWLLDHFTEHNGSTEVVPGSHKLPRKPRPGVPEDEAGLVKVIAPAGSVIVTHGALWHRSGENHTSAERAVLLGSFAASYAREIASEEDIVRCLSPETLRSMSDEAKKLIGYYHGLKPGGSYP